MRERRVDAYHATFHELEPGEFTMGGNISKSVLVVLTKPLAMMATPVTQYVWESIITILETRLPNQYSIPKRPFSFQDDPALPVENVAYDEVQTWIQGLNELSKQHSADLIRFIPGHRSGDIYRLPTEAEWEFVVRQRGKNLNPISTEGGYSRLDEFVWHQHNAQGRTRPVAEKKALMVDQSDFYDLYGNVGEWVSDWYHPDLTGGIDPSGPPKGRLKVYKGGHILFSPPEINSSSRRAWSPGRKLSLIGFRLLRERP
jgi:formylglycine-generating enzyme required for sulfatase activity